MIDPNLAKRVESVGTAYSGPALCDYLVIEGIEGEAEVTITAERSIGEQLRTVTISTADSLVIDCRELDHLRIEVVKNDYEDGEKNGAFWLLWKERSRPSSEFRFYDFLSGGDEKDTPRGAKWIIFGGYADVSIRSYIRRRLITFTAKPGELYRVPGGTVSAGTGIDVCWLLEPI